jgi:hypothetical protein
VPIFIGRGAPVISGVVPDTWVTVDTGDMGNSLVVLCHGH